MKQQWNHFWSLARTDRFTRTSWSKRRIMAILERFCRSGMSILDAGCGAGFFSRFFCDLGCTVDCLDYSEAALERARVSTNNSARAYIQADLFSLGEIQNKRYDCIFTDGLFEHFPRAQQRTLMTIFRSMLDNKGLVITFVPHRYSWWTVIRPFFMPGVKENPLVMKEVVTLHEGMSILESGGINVLPFRLSPEFSGQYAGMLLYVVAHL